MNENYSEQIIDSFLGELVSGQHPPDLSARITEAWEREQGLVRATPVRIPPSASAAAVSIDSQRATTTQLTSNGKPVVLKRKMQGASFRRNLIAALLALGACGLLAFLGSRLIVKQQQGEESLAGQAGPINSNGQTRERPGDAIAGKRAPTGAEPAVARKSPPSAVPLDIEDLPFTLDEPRTWPDAPRRQAADPRDLSVKLDEPVGKLPAGTELDPLSADRNRAAQPTSASQALSDADIVKQIDQQLTQLWQDLKIVPTVALPARERAEQISLRLTGQSLGPALDNSLNVGELADLIKDATSSNSFARLWADKLSKAWFTQGGISLNDPQVAAVQRQIAEVIKGGMPFNRMPIQLLGSEIPNEIDLADSINTLSATPASTFVSALAGNGNHRLVTRIGSSFLDTNLACVRCHEANPSGQSESSVRSNGTRSPMAQQKIYWQLVALLQGIEVQASKPGERIAFDGQAKQLASGKPLVAYFDLLDGRLQAAEPVLPDGQTWQKVAAETATSGPRSALAAWLSQSTALDEATVNQVWKTVFGRPLVSQVPWEATGDVRQQRATQAKRELHQFLANQYRSHGHDLKRLVAWIVQSDAFGRQPLELSHSQWLDASDDDLRQMQLAELNFAAGPLRSRGGEAASLDSSLAAVLRWQGQTEQELNNSKQSNAGSTNSEFADKKESTGKLAQKQAQASMPSLTYALHGGLPSPQDAEFVARLLASSRLSWDQCVMHIVLINPDNSVNGRVKHLADELSATAHWRCAWSTVGPLVGSAKFRCDLSAIPINVSCTDSGIGASRPIRTVFSSWQFTW